MFTELPISAIHQYAAAFKGPQLAMITDSVMAGNTLAHLWALPDEGDRPVVLLWEKGNNGVYLSQVPTEAAAQQNLAQLIDKIIRPRAIAEGRRYFKVRALTPTPDNLLHSLFSGTLLEQRQTRFYGFNAPPPPAQRPLVEGIQFAPINQKLVTDNRFRHSDEIVEEIRGMWPSEERFYAEGFGYAALASEEVICWCTAEFVGPTRCGIGIATRPEFERRGIATATATHLVRHAFERGLTPYWECGSTNIGSRRVAEKVGFELLDESFVWIGRF